MLNHIIALLAGCILDWIIGDPMNFPHPIRLIGSFIAFLTKTLLKIDASRERDMKKEFWNGFLLVVIVLLTVFAVSSFIMVAAYRVNPILGIIVEAIFTCYIMAARSLETESMKVKKALDGDNLEGARFAVSMIVGRDTDVLDKEGIIKAAVETVAENTSDGVIAPLIYTAIGGPVLGWLYKAINTMDSMIGYKNDKYMHFGTAAARLDDIVNFIPARVSALFMIAAAFIGGRAYNGANAFRIFKRDRFNHKSPNSAQTESVCAGALGVQLAGDAMYFGKLVKKPFIGDALRPIEAMDIKRACILMYLTELLTMVICISLLSVIYIIGAV